MSYEYIKSILNARVYDVAEETPVCKATLLSKRYQNNIFVKREDLQPVYSFKIRGAYNKMIQLTEEEKSRGIIAASAGNHAQGVALAAKELGINATIVMPSTTPGIKVNSVRERGANVVLHGDAFDQAAAYAKELQAKEGYTFVHPYDDPEVIAGQGTIGLEILRQLSKKPDVIFIPVGGGGLIAGVSTIVKYLHPEIKIVGVESADSACLTAAIKTDKRVVLDKVGIFADGVAVAQIGENTWELCRQYVDEMVTVNTDEICAAIKDLYDDTRSITEPAGALSLAGLKKYVNENKIEGQDLVTISSGANINFDRLRHISERTEIGEQREAILAVTIPERRGSFKTFIDSLENHSITEFNYRHNSKDEANLFVGLQMEPGAEDRQTLIKNLETHGFTVADLTESEVAKIHIRHMVGGHGINVQNERLYLFEFPEKPGALLKFLDSLGGKWSITMFHYRNHGAAFGRVLTGMEVPNSDQPDVIKFFDELGYRYWEDTDNPAYQLFLK